MKLRSRPKMDDPFDGLTAEEVRRIRGMAAANVTPGMEGLARIAAGDAAGGRPVSGAGDSIAPAATPQRKRGRRA